MKEDDGHHKTCEICHLEIALYRCPRCFIKTCSLKCCKSHKEMHKCNGKRERTAFIPLNKFSDADLLSDYHFLEDALQSSKRAKRLRKDLALLPSTAREGSKSKRPRKNQSVNQEQVECQDDSHCQSSTTSVAPISPLLQKPHDVDQNQVESSNEIANELKKSDNDQSLKNSFSKLSPTSKILQIQESSQKKRPNDNDPDWLSSHTTAKRKMVHNAQMMRNIRLLLMPKGLQRHIQNTSRYDVKKDIFFWRVEFIFHIFLSRKSDINYDDTKKIDGKKKDGEEIEHIKLAVSVERLSDTAIIGNELSKVMKGSKGLKPYLKEYYGTIEDNSYAFMFLRKIPCNSLKPLYLRIDHDKSIQNILKGTTVIEFPSVEVLLDKKYMSKFPTIIQEIESNVGK